MLFTKCILNPLEPDDGIRISIMSRHTMSDGVTPDARLTTDRYQHHWPQLAPPVRLIGDYYKRGIPWEQFAGRYMLFLAIDASARQRIDELIALARQGSVTVLCIEELPNYCHRRLLAEVCKRRDPKLAIRIG